MSKKNSTFINIIALVSLVIFGYLLFFTVYRQMISQNEGFFYVVVFGGILVLVYILLSLMTKLLAFSSDSEANGVFVILEIIFILAISFLFVKLRIAYSTSIPAEESTIYHTAELLVGDELSYGGMDIFPQLLNNPSDFITGYFISIVFRFTGEDPSVITYINTGLLLATSLFIFGITRRLSSRICSLMAFLICLFMPTFGFSIYGFNSQLFYAFILSMCLFFTIIPITQDKSNSATIISTVIAGVLWGISLTMVPAGILILAFILLFNKEKILNKKLSFMMLLISLFVFLVISYFKSLSLELSYGEIFAGYLTSINPFVSESGESLEIGDVITQFNEKLDSQQKAINENYYFLTTLDGDTYSSVKVAWLQLGNQILYMFMIILSIACSFYMIRSKNRRAIPILSAILAAFVAIFLCSGQTYNILYFIILLIISGTISLQYMYENHHALADENFYELVGEEEDNESEASTEDEIDDAAFMLRAQALIFIGANDSYYNQIKFEEKKHNNKRSTDEGATMIINVPKPEEEMPTYIEPPLPMPPKHVPKELDYKDSFENTDENFDFDFDIENDDINFNDFDIE